MRLLYTITAAIGLSLTGISDAPAAAQGRQAQLQPPADAQQPAGTTDSQPRQARRRASPAPRQATSVSVADGTLTVTAVDENLRNLLGEISGRTRIPIVLADSLADARVSAAMRAVPVEEGLKRLLAAYDAFYLFSADERTAPGSVKGIWVFPRGEGRDVEPVPATLWGSTEELETRMDDPDPDVRTETLEALVERLGSRGLSVVQRGLTDPDEGVRLATLSAAENAGVEIPTADLHTAVLTDQSQAVRMGALEALEGRPEAEAIARSLREDLDPVIRTLARQMLGEQENEGASQSPQ